MVALQDDVLIWTLLAHIAVFHAEFHDYFRMEFKQIHELADKYDQEGLSLQQFLRHAEGLHQRKLVYTCSV